MTLYHSPLPGRRTSWAGAVVHSRLTYAAGPARARCRCSSIAERTRVHGGWLQGVGAGRPALSASVFTSAIVELLFYFYLQGSPYRRASG